MTKLEYITPADVKIKMDVEDNILIDMSRGQDRGETLGIDLPESFFDLYRDGFGEVDLQEMWAAVYNGIVDAIENDLQQLDKEADNLPLEPRFPERGRNL